jgi:hypothetical protein
MDKMKRVRDFGVRVTDVLEQAEVELQRWHDRAEAEFGYICPGCSTCATVVPEIRRLIDVLAFSKEGE